MEGSLRHPLALPTEVCERIIDFVAEEYPHDTRRDIMWREGVFEALQACALTCRAWTPRSRVHLFRFLGINCSRNSDKSLDNFYALLDTHKPLQPYAEALLVKSGDGHTNTIHTLPLRLPRILSRLGHLDISYGVLYSPRSLFWGSMRQFKRVTELVLYKVAFYSVHDLRRTICSMQALQSVMISWPSWYTSHSTNLRAPYPPVSTQWARLRLAASAEWMRDSRSKCFVEWLARSGATGSLNEALFGNLMLLGNRMLHDVESVIKTCMDSLRTLVLSWSPDLDVAHLSAVSATLSRCHCLEFLEFYLPWHAKIVPGLAKLLSGVTDIKCRRIILYFHQYPKCPEPTASDWKELDSVLQHPQWSSLQSLNLARHPRVVDDPTEITWGKYYSYGSYSPLDADLWCAEMKNNLPLTYLQGKLWYNINPYGDGLCWERVR